MFGEQTFAQLRTGSEIVLAGDLVAAAIKRYFFSFFF